MHENGDNLDPKKQSDSSAYKMRQNKYYPLGNALFWIVALYLPTMLLSFVFAVYADTSSAIDDPIRWFFDGDTTAVFGILMALVTLPMLYVITFREPNKRTFFALEHRFSMVEFRPYFLITGIYIFASVAIHTAINTQMPQFMVDILNTTDYVWLSVLAICIVAPIFEEIVFRGYIFSRLASTRLGRSGALLITALLFTFLHSQYQGLVLIDLFVLALILSWTRYKTNNLYYCIAIHMLNNMMSMWLLYSVN
ncbi:lysostaphin resistance A-like protein [Thalassotalea maritima]|uniref:CPBP family intramembrane glutamic endopeptidase n=1 Tax=Thalassotalea maritima TaxID=3242416 RepID=UPI0035291809